MCDYIETLIESEIKFLVFAHHISVLNGIEEKVRSSKVKYMRIDGSTKPEQRQSNVELFQADPECKVAVLSTMAAGTGITLTAASNVVFAELAWSPMLLAQAEDRVHRIGQRNSCNIHYLLGKGTIDDDLWPMLSRKLAMINETVSGIRSDVSLMDMSKVDRPDDAKQKQLAGFVKY